MTIKELENELKIPRATIRFYEKENLISPARSNNGYRDYSEDDLSKLKKIIILRKLGITVNDIKSVFEGENELENIVTENIKEIEKQIKELSGALNLSKVICERNENIESFDEDFYWNYVETEEKNGNKFIDIFDGIVKYEKHLILNYFNLEDSEGKLNTSKKVALLKIAEYVILIGIFSLVLGMIENGKFSLIKFKEGIMLPVWWLIIASVIGLPLFFLSKTHPEISHKIKKVLYGIAGGITVFLLILSFLCMAGIIG